jgi:hypothetical protein
MRIEVKITGTKNIQAALARLGARAPKAFGNALWREGNRIMTQAKAITPVDTAALVNSGMVNLPEISGDTVSVTMGFGGAAKDYAIYVHEDPKARHKPPTRYKFLEEPLTNAKQGMRQRLFADLWDDLEHGS